MSIMLDKFYTPQEIGDALQVSSRTIINLIKAGKMRAVIVGGIKRNTYRIYEKELSRFIAENYQRLELWK